MAGYETITSPENNEIHTTVGYTQISPDVQDKGDAVINNYRGLLEELNIFPFYFSDFLDQRISESSHHEEEIIACEFENGEFIIYFSSGNNINFSVNDVKQYEGLQLLGGVTLQQLEERINNINLAIESIFQDNYDGWFQGEIDDKDKVIGDQYGSDLEGKTLSQLRELYSSESEKLHSYYDIVGETEKKQALLMQEIEFFAGVGDKYEGGARYFSLSEEEINNTVNKLTANMSIGEIFEYVKNTNETIEDNSRKSDMVNQINGKLIQALYNVTFEKLKNENHPNSAFIEFAKIVTGRANIVREYVNRRGNTTTRIETIEIDEEYKAFDYACKALIYVMYRSPNGVLDEIQSHLEENQEEGVVVEDEEISGENPRDIVRNAIAQLNKLAPNTPEYGNEILTNAGLGDLIETNKNYNELGFEEKINLGAIYRIGVIIKDASEEELNNPNFIIEKVGASLQDSYDVLNDSFSDNFDGWNGFFGGVDASELGLTGEFAEIFDLYQDINGNSGFWDWSDKNQDRFGNISTLAVLGIGIIAGAIIFAPVLAAGAAGGAMLVAGAQVGAITGIASIALSDQGYDTYAEAIVDSASQLAVDTASGALFSWGLGFGLRTLIAKYPLRNYSTMPDLLFSREAWNGTGLIDKGFILGEVGISGLLISPAVSQIVRNRFNSGHFNSDTHRFEDGEIIKRESN